MWLLVWSFRCSAFDETVRMRYKAVAKNFWQWTGRSIGNIETIMPMWRRWPHTQTHAHTGYSQKIASTKWIIIIIHFIGLFNRTHKTDLQICEFSERCLMSLRNVIEIEGNAKKICETNTLHEFQIKYSAKISSENQYTQLASWIPKQYHRATCTRWNKPLKIVGCRIQYIYIQTAEKAEKSCTSCYKKKCMRILTK